ncbi:G-type lectin S-receptor-like serine/threonine-protein kinase SD2-5 [Zingiber officinale]|uniref:G-type lectin S-receptor-like serine/threonine-protein kinase SD2-5 n=1 Tax=Zingiber officinale TaxID=94328 RepID=UPI001C4CA896|nr:G-type lectin S-receptor-like serine/threonine-protein kinase SD2-5 [Zingiber officinale]
MPYLLILFMLILLLILLLSCACGQFSNLKPNAEPSTVWINNSTYAYSTNSNAGRDDRSIIRPILLYNTTDDVAFACGFFSNPSFDAFLLAVFALYTDPNITYMSYAQVVWSANRDRLVQSNSLLDFHADGDLILRDADGSTVWSTNTSGRGVVGVNITQSGNLVLFDKRNTIVWQSFEHPTDTWVLGQTLKERQSLISNTSTVNWTRGLYRLTLLSDGVYAYVGFTDPQVYHKLYLDKVNGSIYAMYTNGTLDFFAINSTDHVRLRTVNLPFASSIQFMRLESDGHLRIYERTAVGWKSIYDVMSDKRWYPSRPSPCNNPTVCGEYGICDYGMCSCPLPADGYLKPLNDRKLYQGCSLVTPLSCQSIQNHRLVVVPNVSYFIDPDNTEPTIKGIDENNCTQACLENCSCKAVLFAKYYDNYCYLLSQIFTMAVNEGDSSTVYIKVQVNKEAQMKVSVGGLLAIIAGGLPTRFSFEELKQATEQFTKKLGQGGFGSVYEGQIGDQRVAVKLLDGVGQGKKEFLAEVETIGSIHHINLVRLIGFCVEKSNRLLVYEYMSNGSLDKWIFNKSQDNSLDWPTRRRIFADTARGLCYLHEDCRYRIAHLDIKPHNILLNDKFEAKISDFGLAKLIDRDQSQVMTRLRGTPGYLAPEWLTSIITEKVDIYSFGVVVLETIFGRRNLDYSQPEENFHLLQLIQDKIKSGGLTEMINQSHLELNFEDVILMIHLAGCCIQSESNRRPSMSTVVKILEGAATVETDLQEVFDAVPIAIREAVHLDASTPPSATQVSGPR